MMDSGEILLIGLFLLLLLKNSLQLQVSAIIHVVYR